MVVLLDQGLKWGAVHVLESTWDCSLVFFTLTFVAHSNPGSVWGHLSHVPLFLLTVRFVVLMFLLAQWFRSDLPRRECIVWILCGAMSNLCDVYFYGAVIDFASLSLNTSLGLLSSPIFNLGDVCILIGMVRWMHYEWEKHQHQHL